MMFFESCIPSYDGIEKKPYTISDLESEMILCICDFLEPKSKLNFRISTKELYTCSFGCSIDLSSYYLKLNKFTYQLVKESSWVVTDIGMVVDKDCTEEKVNSFFFEMFDQNVIIRKIQISNESTVDNIKTN